VWNENPLTTVYWPRVFWLGHDLSVFPEGLAETQNPADGDTRRLVFTESKIELPFKIISKTQYFGNIGFFD